MRVRSRAGTVRPQRPPCGVRRKLKPTQPKGEQTTHEDQPWGDRVLVEPIEENEQNQGRDHHSRFRQGKAQEGKVIAIGTGKRDEDGKEDRLQRQGRRRVLMPKYGGTEVKIDDKEYQIIREDDILGVIKD
jgi:chaperonin GroES